MKKILLLLSVCLLCACTAETDFTTMMESSLEKGMSVNLRPANINKPYYSFYLEPSVGRISATQTSDIITIDGVKVAMNLNVPEIVNSNFFTEVPVAVPRLSQDPILKTEGTFIDSCNLEQSWKLSVYDLDENHVIVFFTTSGASFYATCARLQASGIVEKMMKIARTVEVDTERVLDAYTTEDTVIFTSDTLNLFESVAPVNGRIEELFETENMLGVETVQPTDGGMTQIDSDDITNDGITD